jgi:transcriptional regulator GlxA family with amidase domain
MAAPAALGDFPGAACPLPGSAARLRHLFRDHLDASPRNYSEKIRLDFARELLGQTNLSVTKLVLA